MAAWQSVKLGEVCEIQRGGSPRPIETFITEADNGINWIKIGDVPEGAKYITSTKEKIRPEGATRSRSVREGDFLLSNSMSFGRPYILRTSGCIHDGWLVLRYDKERLTEDYLYHALSSNFVYGQFAKLAVGAVVKNLNSEVVKQVTISLPPLEEQRRIAAILDQADALRAKRREALAEIDKLTQSIFLEMFGDPGSNPLGWLEGTLRDLTIDKPNNGIFKKNEDYGEGIPVVWVEELFRGNVISLSKSRRLLPTPKQVEQYGLKNGDVLFCRSSLKLAGVGYNNVYLGMDKKALFECHVIRLSPDKSKVVPEFLNYILRIPNQRQKLFKFAKTVTMSTIDQEGLLKVSLPIPPLELQIAFVKRLNAIDRIRATHSEALSELETLFSSLQHRAFRGEL